MANPYADKAKGTSKAKYKAMTGKSGKGQTHSDESQDKQLFNKMFAEKKAEGKIPGKTAGGRLDKFARGGRTKGTNVNIAIVVPGKSGEPPAPGVPPLLPPGAGPGGGPGLPPEAMMSGPGAMPMIPPGPPIMPPGGGSSKPTLRASGGRIPRKLGGGAATDDEELVARGGASKSLPESRPAAMAQEARDAAAKTMRSRRDTPSAFPMPERKSGGKVKMTGGAEGGLGRLQKARAAAKVNRG